MNMQMLTHIGWLYFVKKGEIVYFDSFGVEHVPEEIKKIIGNKNIKANIFRVKSNNSIMCGYTFALDSFILCLLVKAWLVLLVCFLLMF